MSRNATIWWNRQKGTWCTELGGKRRSLAKGKRRKRLAAQRLKALLEERALLESVNGPITVAALAEEFLEFAAQNLEPPTCGAGWQRQTGPPRRRSASSWLPRGHGIP